MLPVDSAGSECQKAVLVEKSRNSNHGGFAMVGYCFRLAVVTSLNSILDSQPAFDSTDGPTLRLPSFCIPDRLAIASFYSFARTDARRFQIENII